MAEYTTHYNITKPTGSEAGDVSVVNANMDIIDGQMYDNEQAIGVLNDLETTEKSNLVGAINENTQAIQENSEAIQTNTEDIEALNTYSTTEQRIGTWIDGKPLYRKVLIVNSKITGGSNYNYPHGISDLDTVVHTEILVSFTNGWIRTLNFVYAQSASDFSWYGGYAINNSDIVFQVGTRFGDDSNRWIAILEYTKTTD